MYEKTIAYDFVFIPLCSNVISMIIIIKLFFNGSFKLLIRNQTHLYLIPLEGTNIYSYFEKLLASYEVQYLEKCLKKRAPIFTSAIAKHKLARALAITYGFNY